MNLHRKFISVFFIELILGLYCSFSFSQTVTSDLQTALFFGTGVTPTWAHTTTTAANRIILVSANTAPKTGTTASGISGITYGSTSMTFLAKAEYQSGLKSYLYYLLNPASGSNTITVTKSNTNDYCAVASASFSNVNQVVPPTNTFGGNTTSASATIATIYQNDLLLGFCGTANNVTGLGAGQTQLCEAGSGSKVYVNLCSKTAVGISSTFSVSIAATSADWELILLPLSPLNAAYLPIELTKFNAECENKNVIVSWSTASERDNDYFTIEKSLDGNTFETVSNVPGQGNSLTPKDYTLTDDQPYSGDSYYRISQTDHNGQRQIFPMVHVVCEENDFGVFPNPTSGVIKISGASSGDQLQVIDARGNCVLSNIIASENKEIDLSAYPEGIYYIRFSNAYESKATKVIKN